MSESKMALALLCDGDHWRELEFGISLPLLLVFSHLTMQVELKEGFILFSGLSCAVQYSHAQMDIERVIGLCNQSI